MKQVFFSFIFFLTTSVSFCQHYVLDSITPSLGHLIHFDKNQFYFAEDSPYFQKFFERFDSIYKGKQEKLHIFHIGGSHIQADIYSNKIRTYLQNSSETMQGQRGFVFPYHLAHTNNPISYQIEANTEKWTGYRCSIRKDSIAWGLAGITAAFRDKIDTIYLKSNYRNYTKKPYTFNRLRLFYNTWKDDYSLRFLDSTLVERDSLNTKIMYREYFLKHDMDSVAVEIKLKDTTLVNPEFLFMGAEFVNDIPGIQYTSIGVNGASFKYYDRSAFFEKQLSLYKPDLFIISIGTNDAYVPASYFDPLEFKDYYEAFIRMIQRFLSHPHEEPEDIARVNQELKQVRQKLEDAGVAHEVHEMARGLSPGEDIVIFAKENQIDQIFVGIEKKSRTRKLLLGSTAQYIILKADCPVTTIK